MLWALLFVLNVGIVTESEIEEIKDEIASELVGLRFGKIFQIDPYSLAIDFFPHSGRYLFLSFEKGNSGAYLIRRKLKHLEREAIHPTIFTVDLSKRFFGAELTAVSADGAGRVLRFQFRNSTGAIEYLVIQLCTKHPGIFVLDADHAILASSSNSDLAGQQVGDLYGVLDDTEIDRHPVKGLDGQSLSDRLDAENLERLDEKRFDQTLAEARRQINSEIRRRVKLIENLEDDLLKRGDPDQWKRYGDLLLANIGNLRRGSDKITVIDFFDEQAPDMDIPADANSSPTELAEKYFKRYTKARNAVAAISERLSAITEELKTLRAKLDQLSIIETSRDRAALAELSTEKKGAVHKPGKSKSDQKSGAFRGARRFISSDGYEILVGKKAADNDQLTFRISRSLDTWLHAADYPGSHVIVRNPGKQELPTRTLIEAAQLAAFYSDARGIPKAAVRFTLRKFVNKPRKGAPGLVSLSSFKTILVEPQIGNVTLAE